MYLVFGYSYQRLFIDLFGYFKFCRFLDFYSRTEDVFHPGQIMILKDASILLAYLIRDDHLWLLRSRGETSNTSLGNQPPVPKVL